MQLAEWCFDLVGVDLAQVAVPNVLDRVSLKGGPRITKSYEPFGEHEPIYARSRFISISRV